MDVFTNATLAENISRVFGGQVVVSAMPVTRLDEIT